MALEARDGAREPAGTRAEPMANPGPRPSRRVALLVDAEPLAAVCKQGHR